MDGYMSTQEAMAALGLSKARVVRMVQDGTLKGEKVGNSYIIDAESVERAKTERRPRGNPNFGPDFWKTHERGTRKRD